MTHSKPISTYGAFWSSRKLSITCKAEIEIP